MRCPNQKNKLCPPLFPLPLCSLRFSPYTSTPAAPTGRSPGGPDRQQFFNAWPISNDQFFSSRRTTGDGGWIPDGRTLHGGPVTCPGRRGSSPDLVPPPNKRTCLALWNPGGGWSESHTLLQKHEASCGYGQTLRYTHGLERKHAYPSPFLFTDVVHLRPCQVSTSATVAAEAASTLAVAGALLTTVSTVLGAAGNPKSVSRAGRNR